MKRCLALRPTTLATRELESLPIPFACVATELDTGREIWLQQGPLRQSVRASCGMPGILTPTRVNDRWLVDGAVVNPVPISLARAMGAEVVIAVNLNTDMHQPWTDEPDQPGSSGLLSQWLNRGETPPATPGLWSVMSGAINIMQERITRARMAGDPPDIQLCPPPWQFIHHGFSSRQRRHQRGGSLCRAQPRFSSRMNWAASDCSDPHANRTNKKSALRLMPVS